MWLAVLLVLGSCLPLAASEGCPEASEDTSSWVRLKPLGHCRDGESTCPYRITLPQLTIQLPKPFRELEKMARELQSLTQMVNQLKADCRECKERQRMQWNLRTADPGEDGERIQASRGTVNTKERQQDLQKREKVTQGNTHKTEEEQDRVLVNSGTKQVTLTGSWDKNSNPHHTGLHRHENSQGPKGSNPTQTDGKAKNMSKVSEPHLPVTEVKGNYPRVVVTESLPENQDEVQTTQAFIYTADQSDRQDREDDVSRRVDVVQDSTQVPPLKSTEDYDTTFTSSGTKQMNPAGIEDKGWNSRQDRNPEISSTGHKDGHNSGGPTGSNPTHSKQVITTGQGNQRQTSSWDRNSNPGSTGHKDENSERKTGSNPTQPKQVTTTGMENQRWTGTWNRNSNPSRSGHKDENSEGSEGSNPALPKQVITTGMENQRWTSSRDRTSNPSSSGHKAENNEGSEGSNPALPKQVTTTGMENQRWTSTWNRNTNLSSTGHKNVNREGSEGSSPTRPKQVTTTGMENQRWTSSRDRTSNPSSSGHKAGNSEGSEGSNPALPKQVTTTRIENQRWTSTWNRNSNLSSTGHKNVNREGSEGSSPTRPKQVTTTGMENQRWTSSWNRNSNSSDIGHRDESNGGLKGSNPTHMDAKTKNMSKVSQPHLPLAKEKDKDLHSARVILTESALPRNQDVGKQLNPAGTEKQSWHLGQEKNPKIESRTGHRVETSGGPSESNPAHTSRRPDGMDKTTESNSFLSEERDRELQSPGAELSKSDLLPTKLFIDTINTREGLQDMPPKKVQGITQNNEEETMFTSSAPKQLGPGDMEKQKWNTNQERNPTSSRIGHRDETSGDLREANPPHTGKNQNSSSKVTESRSYLLEEREKESQYPRGKLSESVLSTNQDVSSDTVITRSEEQDIPQRGVQGTTQKNKEGTVPTSSGRKELSQTGIQKQRWNPRQDRIFNVKKTGPRNETSGGLKQTNPMHIERTTESPNKAREQPSQSQDEDQAGHGENHNNKANTSQVGQGGDSSGTLTAEGKIESIPESSVVPIVLEDDHIETKQRNPPTQNKPVKRFPGFPRLINTNITAVQGTSNNGNRLANLSDPKRFSPFGNRTVNYFNRGTGINPVRIRPKEKIPHKSDNKEETGSRDADMVHVHTNAPRIINSKNVLGERQPVTGTKAKNNSELNLNMTESPKTVSANQGEDISDTRTRVKEPGPFMVDKTSDSVVAKEGTTNMVQYAESENKEKKEKINHSGESVNEPHSKPSQSNQDTVSVRDTEVDAKLIKPVETAHGSKTISSDNEDATFDVRHTDPQTQDSQHKNPFTPGRNAESGTRMDSVNPAGTVSKPEKNKADQIQDKTDKTSGTVMHLSPINTPGTGLVDASSTYPQSLDNKNDLPKGQIKPDHNTTRQGTKETESSHLFKEETGRQNGLTTKEATLLGSDPVKQTSTARSREEKIPERSVSKPEAPAVGSKVKGRPRPSNLMPIRSEKLNPHTRNSTKNPEGAKELSQPNQRMVKNVTRSIPNHAKQPERTASGRVIQAMNPKQKKPYILQKTPENIGLERVENTSGVNEHMVDRMNARRRQDHPKIGPTLSSPSQEIKSTTNAMTQSVRPTVAGHNIVDQVHLEKAKTAPTVEAINSLNTHQIQNTLQNAETKLFHVSEPGNPGGKRGLDPVTDSVREHSVEKEMNQTIVSFGSNNQSRPDSDQAVVEKSESTDRQKGTNLFTDSSAASNQENNKKLLTGGGMQNSRGKNLTTVEKVSTERNELNYPTTAATFTIKTAIKRKQSQMTQTTAPVVTTSPFMTQVHAEKAKSIFGAKVSNTHVPHRNKNPSLEVEPKILTETVYDSSSRNKEQNPRIRLDTERRVGGGSDKETVSYPNSVDIVPNRARGSDPFVMDKITNTAGPKWSTPSTDSMPHTPLTTTASVLGKNGDNNGNSYPVAVDKVGNAKIIKEGILIEPVTKSAIKENTEKPLTFNNLEDRDGLENQLLSTCHGHCNPSPTPQPDINIQRSSENYKDKTPRDCSDLIKKNHSNGVYSVTPGGSNKSTFMVFCDMEVSGGGWTVIQHRFDGSISFNRTWNDYKRGFGNLTGEFWLGNDKIHWLTSTRAMVLRVELEDLDGVKEYAQYNRFRVANESQHYRLSIGGYSGTAGNAMQFSKKFNHDQKNFTTPDRDNDRYPSGNCGAYYSSGWWFDACMAANLNGKYYEMKYKGTRNGIFWGTWHNISTEYYLTNDRQSFKTVRMMVRPRMAAGRDY
ncbi:hypothetical protein AMEX_G13378 [Astyanax mexicanus]|nr:hypothetical protein AMEX_G13378 [Astyanax mexicanus]